MGGSYSKLSQPLCIISYNTGMYTVYNICIHVDCHFTCIIYIHVHRPYTFVCIIFHILSAFLFGGDSH